MLRGFGFLVVVLHGVAGNMMYDNISVLEKLEIYGIEDDNEVEFLMFDLFKLKLFRS